MEAVVHYCAWRHASFKFVRAAHFWKLVVALLIHALRTFSSSAPSGLLPVMMRKFGFGEEVATLTVSLFVAGYCLGPIVWGPLSEDVSCFYLLCH
jgi:MFS family permease